MPSGFELVGELGRDGTAAPVYLAREVVTDQLVALKLAPEAATDVVQQDTTVFRSLGAGVPAGARVCPICRGGITDWRSYCPRCGTDVSGKGVGTGADPAAELASLVKDSAADALDVLGSMPREQGGGPVYFARDRQSGEILALTLDRRTGGATGEAPYGLTVTSMIPTRPVPASGRGSSATPPPPHAGAVPMSPASPPSAAPIEPAEAVKVCPSCTKEFGASVHFCPHDGSVLRPREASEELIGQIVAERYHVLRKLGQGGMGQVYLAEHVKMGRRCALKVMHRALGQDVSAISRFGREAANASKINHPRVATIYDFGESMDRLVYIAMEYVEGESLAGLLRQERPLAPARAVAIARQIADALDAAHAEGVIHRDLKPDNILIARPRGGDEVVKVVDFGIAKAILGDADGLTRTGFIVGTPRYMSPEQLIAEGVDARSDVYALGCVLYEMLVGEPVFGDRAVDLTRRLTEPPPRPRARNRDVPAELDDIVARALARAPADRFQSAAEMRDALLHAMQPGPQERSGWLDRVWSRRQRTETPRSDAQRAATAQGSRPVTGARTGVGETAPDRGVASGSGEKRSIAAADVTPASISPGASASPAGQAAPPAATPAPLSPPTPSMGGPDASNDRGVQVGPTTDVTLLREPSGGTEIWPGLEQLPRPTRAERARNRRRYGIVALAVVVASSTVGGLWWALARGSAPDAGPAGPMRATGLPTLPAPPPDAGARDQEESQTPASAADPGPGALRLAGELPAGARVTLDGRPIRASGEPISLAPGAHRVIVEAPGYERWQWNGTVRSEQQLVLEPVLKTVSAAAPSQSPDAAVTAPVAAPEAAATTPRPTTFAEFAARDIERLRLALESRDFERVRATVRGIPDVLATELRTALSGTGSQPLRVTAQVVGLHEPAADFYLNITDPGDPARAPVHGFFEAQFQPRPDGSWLLLGITRRR